MKPLSAGAAYRAIFTPRRSELARKTPFERALIRNLRMLNRHLWELRGEVSMVCEQIVIERNEAARAKGRG